MLDQLFITTDHAKFKNAVRERVQTAIKCTADGGSIAIDGVEDESNRPTLSVSDTGVGIAEEEQARIFELFYGVGEPIHPHSSAADFLGGGMGVGLAIVGEIAAAYQGTMEVDSSIGKGSTFTLITPQHPPA